MGKQQTADKSSKPEAPQNPGEKLDQLIKHFEDKMKTDQPLKVAEYLKLIELRNEREDRRPKQITVKWIDQWESDALND